MFYSLLLLDSDPYPHWVWLTIRFNLPSLSTVGMSAEDCQFPSLSPSWALDSSQGQSSQVQEKVWR